MTGSGVTRLFITINKWRIMRSLWSGAHLRDLSANPPFCALVHISAGSSGLEEPRAEIQAVSEAQHRQQKADPAKNGNLFENIEFVGGARRGVYNIGHCELLLQIRASMPASLAPRLQATLFFAYEIHYFCLAEAVLEI
jgi:hypothetical protein